jgi:hypothetical protein
VYKSTFLKLNALKFAKATGENPENINFAIKTGAVRDFLDNSVVTYQTAESKAEVKTADIARAARAYTMLVSCTAPPGVPPKRMCEKSQHASLCDQLI